MGTSNRARRAAKVRSRTRNRSRRARRVDAPGARSGEPPIDDADHIRALLFLAARAQQSGDTFALELRGDLRSLPPALVDRVAEALLLQQIDVVWAGGWQPAELLRQGRLGCTTAAAARLVALGIATDHAGRREVTLDPRWSAQVEGLDLPVVNGKPGWVERWARDEGLPRDKAVAALVDVLANLFDLPRLDPILPPPGDTTARARSGASVAPSPPDGAEIDPVLSRIRGLLAKAESTTFEAEATALTAKAQELMTRHAIDAAMLVGRSQARADAPVASRVPVDAPYADAKSLLLQTVAQASRCRSVFDTRLAMSTVVGYPDDVAAVEMLFTSLLVQAQTALAEAADRAPAGTRTRSQSYRSAFLLAYTHRIGARLDEINARVTADVESERGGDFLPVLRSRAAQVDDEVAKRFGDLLAAPVRGGYDPAGWARGTLAADNARLAFADLADGAAPST